MSHRLVVLGLIPLLVTLPVGPALAFSRVPESLNSESRHQQPLVPDNQKYPSRHVYVPPPIDPMKEIRKRMVAGDKVSDGDLRALADSGDDLACFNYGKRMEAAGDPESLDTAARFYLKSLHLGRKIALRPLIRALKGGALMDEPKNLASAQDTLDKLADKGNLLARDGMLAMYRDGVPFGANPERVDALIAEQAKSGDTQAALNLALALLSATPDADQLDEARSYLEIAATSETLNVRTVAENLLRGLAPKAEVTVATENVQ